MKALVKRGAKLEAWGDWVPAWMAALYVNVGIKKALLRGQNQIWIDAFESGCTLLGATLEPLTLFWIIMETTFSLIQQVAWPDASKHLSTDFWFS